ncbi:MAG: tRNA(Ser) Um(44) 2'-O-methyltransferase [Piccolia ochrophora]|nr:MAG: tRNA(Ser) Um(44) 2'-O-methyltransferase [Piccolia ochrophora]
MTTPPPFSPTDLKLSSSSSSNNNKDTPYFSTTPSLPWRPVLAQACTFLPAVFDTVMWNLILNPNINSSYLFRADILFRDGKCGPEEDQVKGATTRSGNDYDGDGPGFEGSATPIGMHADGFERKYTVVRRLIPRNPNLDKHLLQTCHSFHTANTDDATHLVIYLPHADDASAIPYYHPPVRALAFLHSTTPWPSPSSSRVSIHVAPFPGQQEEELTPRLRRTILHLLETLHKHGHGTAAGYTKRVRHDRLVSQPRYQDAYTAMKGRHAKRLVESWVEVTDPGKHVFEDLGIAAFLTEIWKDMYGQGAFPGFVDVGCGNGILVDVLCREGWAGWGFDARRRKSWETFSEQVQANLKEMVLVPEPLCPDDVAKQLSSGSVSEEPTSTANNGDRQVKHHNGVFANGTFIISNHADELTGWTPLLAALSASPFIIIPCCSHDLSGARFRAPLKANAIANTTAKDGANNKPNKPPSSYASLVSWVTYLATSLGYEVETEMLRIPSTRNTALFGRRRNTDSALGVEELLKREGGGEGWLERAMKLTKSKARTH